MRGREGGGWALSDREGVGGDAHHSPTDSIISSTAFIDLSLGMYLELTQSRFSRLLRPTSTLDRPITSGRRTPQLGDCGGKEGGVEWDAWISNAMTAVAVWNVRTYVYMCDFLVLGGLFQCAK